MKIVEDGSWVNEALRFELVLVVVVLMLVSPSMMARCVEVMMVLVQGGI